MKIGARLASGGARGYVHIGVLQAQEASIGGGTYVLYCDADGLIG